MLKSDSLLDRWLWGQKKWFRPAAGALLAVGCGLVLWSAPFAESWVNTSYDYLFRFVRREATGEAGPSGALLQGEVFSDHSDFSLKSYLEESARKGKFEVAQVGFQVEAMDRVRAEWSSRLAEERTECGSVLVTLLAYSLEGLAVPQASERSDGAKA